MARRRPSQAPSRRRSRDLLLEALEGRQLLAANVAVGNDAGEASSPLVRLVDAETGAERASVLAFEPTFKGGVRLAMGQVTGNAAPDVVVGSGSGRVNEVKVFKPLTVGSTTTLTQVLSFRPFGDAYRGGIEVAVGDIDGDGIHDIIVGKSRDGGDVKVFRVTNPGGTTTVTPYATIGRPFGATYNGGSTVGVADVGEFTNGALVKSVSDNKVEVLVGSGAGIPGRVRVYDMSRPATPRVADVIVPFGPLFQGGVSVTSGRYAASGVADAVDDIVVSAGRGGASQTRVFDGTVSAAENPVRKAFAPYAGLPRPNAAVFTAAVDADGNGQIDRFLTSQGDPGGRAGLANVSIAGARAVNPVTTLVGPLRVAAARTVFPTQTINGIVNTPSPTAGVAAGSSQPMQIREIVTGSGATANVGNTLTVQYTGMLTNGTVFDTSRQTGRTAFTFTLGSGQVISGWEAGVAGMKVGGRRLLVIPPALGYGDAGSGSKIPGGSTLVFDVELVSVTGNSTASISGTSTGALTEDGSPSSVGGTLTVTDPDSGQAVFAAPGALNKTYGAFTFDATTGVWSYALDNGRPATQALSAGQAVTDSLTVTSLDGTASRAIVVTVTGAAEAPSNIVLSASVAPENAAPGTVIGTLSTTDGDAGETFTYTLVSGAGDTDNAAFTIDGATLKTAAALNFEAQSSYSIRVRSTDSTSLSTERVLTVTVTNVNEAPTDIGISAATVADTATVGTVVGTLFGIDADANQTFTYALVSGAGDSGNAAFTIVGEQLKTAVAFDFATQSSYSIRVRATDGGGLSHEKALTITLVDNTAATIGGTATAALSADGPVFTVGNTLTVTDPDAGQAAFAEPDVLDGTFGSFTFDATTGQWTYALDANRTRTIALTSDQTVTDSFTVTSLDGTASRTVEVTITGHTMQTRSAVVKTPSPSAGVPAGSTSSLRYRDVILGSGLLAEPGTALIVDYVGMLTDGTEFDSSLRPGRDPFQFTLGAGQVIRGWDAGVEGMRVGGTRVLVIPPELAYGDASLPGIPAGSTLVFVVEVIAASAPTVTPPA